MLLLSFPSVHWIKHGQAKAGADLARASKVWGLLHFSGPQLWQPNVRSHQLTVFLPVSQPILVDLAVHQHIQAANWRPYSNELLLAEPGSAAHLDDNSFSQAPQAIPNW